MAERAGHRVDDSPELTRPICCERHRLRLW